MFFEIKNYESMRQAIDELCRLLTERNVSEEKVFDSKLVATELLSNVLRHGTGEGTLYADFQDGHIQIRVHSAQAFIPPKYSQKASVYAEHGRGLYLIDAICEERTGSQESGIIVRIRIDKE